MAEFTALGKRRGPKGLAYTRDLDDLQILIVRVEVRETLSKAVVGEEEEGNLRGAGWKISKIKNQKSKIKNSQSMRPEGRRRIGRKIGNDRKSNK